METYSFMQNNPQSVRKGIVERIRARRKEQGFTQQALAKKSAVSYGSIKRFEQTGEISLSSLIRIAFALGYEHDLDQLFSQRHYASIQEIIDEQH